MIRRTTDDAVFNESELKNLANIINKQNSKKLYKVCMTQEDALIAIKELKLNGYNYDIVDKGDRCFLYSVQPESIDLREASASGQFKKLSWGRYSFQKVNAIGDFQKYNFDDGSIWKVITGQDGKQYLVKEVDDEDEDRVIRTKLGNLQKKAELSVDQSNINTIIPILFGNNNTFLIELLKSNIGNQIVDFVKQSFNMIVEEKLKNMNVTDQSIKDLVVNNISNKVLSGEIKNIDSINYEIEIYLQNGENTIQI